MLQVVGYVSIWPREGCYLGLCLSRKRQRYFWKYGGVVGSGLEFAEVLYFWKCGGVMGLGLGYADVF